MAAKWLRDANKYARARRIQADPHAVNLNAPPPYGQSLGDTLAITAAATALGSLITFALMQRNLGSDPEINAYSAIMVGAFVGLNALAMKTVWWSKQIERWINEGFEIRRQAANHRFNHPIYSETETVTIPPQGYLALPAKRTRLQRAAYDAIAQIQIEEPENAVRMIDVNSVLWRWAHYDWSQGTGERIWTPQPFDVAEWRCMRDYLLSQNMARWKSEKDHRQGWEITQRTRAILQAFQQRKDLPPTLIVPYHPEK